MELPKLPTDSFYIFLAILGGAMMLFGFESIQKQQMAQIEKISQLLQLQDTIFADSSKRNLIYDKISDDADYFVSRAKAVKDKDEKKKLADSAISKLQQVASASADEKKLLMKYKTKKDTFDTEQSINDTYLWLYFTFLVIGAFLTLIGFYRWYNKYQVVQDEILLLQRDKLKHEVENMKKADTILNK